MLSSEILYLAELHGFTPEATQALLEAAEAWADVGAPAEPTASGPGFTMFETVQDVSEGPSESTPSGSAATEPARAPLPMDHARDLRPIEDLGLIARGGMGEVRRVRDPNLSRTVAMKVARPGLAQDANQLVRFLAEARVTAGLQHPGIVPVHALGFLPDGRPYFLMREVTGPTLSTAIREVHQASRGAGRWVASPSGWTFRRLVDALLRACEAVAYAHAQGVVHRDLKPENIMLGRYGEVLVLDWGLARVPLGADVPAQTAEDDDEISLRTIAGTPAYMPPEQARGQFDAMGPEGDVYALGAALYEILAGRAPYEGRSALDVLELVRARAPRPPRDAAEAGTPPIPHELEEICARAMARSPGERWPNAGALGRAITDWLEGVKRREAALALVARADALRPEVHALRQHAAAMRSWARAMQAELPPGAGAADREPVWALDDEAAAAEQRARLVELEVVQGWRAALSTEPDLPEAHERLADHYRALMGDAEERRDHLQAEAAGVLLKSHDVAGRHAAWLDGEGTLTLRTEPQDAEVTVLRYEEVARRLVARPVGGPLRAPVLDLPLPMGSYLLLIRAEGCAQVRYPVHLRRCERWTGVPPGASGPLAIDLPRADELGPDDVYVPAGWFLSGGGPDPETPLRRVWVDGFVIRRYPVTNAEYLFFLNDLISNDQEEQALEAAPRTRGGHAGERGALLYHRGPDGQFFLGEDAEGHLWLPDYPVLNIDWFGARAYAAWEAARSGRPWRLPGELEREKATRGVDGRLFPWGDFLDPSFCCYLESHHGARRPAPIGTFPTDEGPYGARDLAGNSRDWCLEHETSPPVAARYLVPRDDGETALRATRGGSWLGAANLMGAPRRFPCDPRTRRESIGLRLARSWPTFR